MRALEGLLGIVLSAGLFVGIVWAVSYHDEIATYFRERRKRREQARVERQRNKPIPASHVCKEFTQWSIVKEIPIYTYPDPDAGRDLPDRIDAVMRRACTVCGMPQTRTVRGA